MYVGVDIGGTKCAVIKGDSSGRILEKHRFDTEDFSRTTNKLLKTIDQMVTAEIRAIGISCGGPLDSRKGIILAPPCLSDWRDYPITAIYEKRYGIPVYLQNDADACAVAEWKFGAGKGYENVVFLTFGTGMGAGLILNGQLYSGTCDGAGEIGHVRLRETGHIGFRKAGSVEGYCSGFGIEQYGRGNAKELAFLARAGDREALDIFCRVGRDFGRALAILVDILNPQVIIAGSIFTRCQDLMEASMWEELRREALDRNLSGLRITGSMLGENVGDMAALCVAIENDRTQERQVIRDGRWLQRTAGELPTAGSAPGGPLQGGPAAGGYL